MDDPTRRNRLSDAGSPYLRQHADNPVHWQPWDEAALDAARERDVPIFLSIGYSACHWCHVMEEESFEDPDVAELLNEHFVPIKVDREERPDLDSVYMTVCQLVRGGGGWPLSVWLTPDREPFYVGTYFPPEATPGQTGFRNLLEDVHEAWETDREEIEQRAHQWAQAAAGELEAIPDQPGEPPDDVLVRAAEAAVRSADRENGGFGGAPKFPHPRRVDLLSSAHRRTGREAFREVAVETLDAMADGGIYDHLGGGFHRYATDEDWTVPHFEKMLYDNAELAHAYLEGYRATGDERYATVAAETLDFADRELGHPDGGFFSTLDARSRPPGTDSDSHVHDEEGAYYVWTPDQVRSAIGDDDLADLFCDRYGVTEAGNFEGKTVLTAAQTVESLAEARELEAGAVTERLAEARARALDARETRPRPARDEKVIGAWNGLAVSAFAEAGLALDPGYADRAVDALDFVREHLWDGDRLARRYVDGDVRGSGYLEDYAFLARGALDCYQAAGDVAHLAFALDLARALVGEFWDAEDATLYYTPASGESLLARPQELTDQSTPSSTGVAVEVLTRLAAFAPDEPFDEVARRTVETHAETITDRPLQHASLALAADERAVGTLELTVAADALPASWRDRLGRAHVPNRLLSRRPPDQAGLDAWLDRLDLDEAPAIWANRGWRETDDAEKDHAPVRDDPARPTAYVCRRACSPPLSDMDDVLAWIEELEPPRPE